MADAGVWYYRQGSSVFIHLQADGITAVESYAAAGTIYAPSVGSKYVALCGTSPPYLWVYDRSTQQLASIPTVTAAVYAVRLSPDETKLIYTQTSGSVTILDLTTMQVETSFSVATTTGYTQYGGISWSPDGNWVMISWSSGSRCVVLDTSDWSYWAVGTLIPITYAWHPTSAYVWTGYYGSNSRIWSAPGFADGITPASLVGVSYVYGNDISPDGTKAAAITNVANYRVMVLDLTNGWERLEFGAAYAAEESSILTGYNQWLLWDSKGESLYLPAGTPNRWRRRTFPAFDVVENIEPLGVSYNAQPLHDWAYTKSFLIRDYAGNPLQGVVVDLWVRASGIRFGRFVTDASGEVEITAPREGDYWLAVEGSSASNDKITPVVITETSSTDPRETIFVPNLGSPNLIAGVVTASAAGADRVVVYGWESGEYVGETEPDNATGSWTLSVPPGTYGIAYFAANHAPAYHGPYTVYGDNVTVHEHTLSGDLTLVV